MVRLDGGEFRMGTDGPWAYDGDGEVPVHAVELAPFWIDATTVTNDAFAAFVAATGHVTDAERYEWSFVFAGLLPDDFDETRAVAQSPWWRQVYGADWRHPDGPQSDLDRARRSTRRARVVAGRDRVRAVDRQAAPDRGRVGVRGARRSRRQALPVGQRPRARRRSPHERVAGDVPDREHAGRRLPRAGACHLVPTERLRSLRDDRQRVGVVRRLVRHRLLPRVTAREPARA